MTMLRMILTKYNNAQEIKKLNKQQNICNFMIIHTTKLYKNSLILFKISEKTMKMIKNKEKNTELELVILDSLVSIFNTKSEFITDKKNVSKILKIKNKPFNSRIKHRNDGKISLITNSELPKLLHKNILKEALINEDVEFNDKNFSISNSLIDKDSFKSQVNKNKSDIKRKYFNTNEDCINNKQKNAKKIKCK